MKINRTKCIYLIKPINESDARFVGIDGLFDRNDAQKSQSFAFNLMYTSFFFSARRCAQFTFIDSKKKKKPENFVTHFDEH